MLSKRYPNEKQERREHMANDVAVMGHSSGLRQRGRLAGVLHLARERVSTFAIVLFCVLLLINLAKLPSFLSASNIPSTLANAAPFVLAAMAATPAMLSGGGGVDVSVGPLMGLINAFLIVTLASNGLAGAVAAIPILLAVGLGVGLINGLLVTVVRLQPIVATLSSYLVLTGVTLIILPQPAGTAPGWVNDLGGSMGGIPGAVVIVAVPVVAWALLWRTQFRVSLLAVGGDDRTAFTAGTNVLVIRTMAYALGGLLAAVAGIALTALVGSGDPTLGPQYTLTAIAAAAFGGTSLAGGRGGMTGSIFAAVDIYLVQNALSAFRVSSYWLQVVYGAILVGALIANFGVQRLGRTGTV
jgi:ribose transport system permease protein